MPRTMRVKRRSMWSRAMKLSGRMTRSTDECEMSRSCQSATFSSAAMALARTQPGEAGDLLAADRVALVRHRRRALLPLAERLFDFADFGLLQPANLERELLERRRRDRQRRHQLGVPIALNDLRRDRRRLRARAARRRAPRSPDRDARTCRPRRRSCRPTTISRARSTRSRSRCSSAYHSASFSPKRHRLGVHAVRPPDHRRAAVLVGARRARPPSARRCP